jgi:probable HAF family extracellular repeat protein
VVGWSNTASYLTRAFRWANGVLTELEGFDGQGMWAYGVNDRGQIVGEWGGPSGVFLWENGVAVDIGSLGGGSTRFRALGEDGSIVGYGMTAAGGQHAFLWRDGQMIDLGLGPSEIGAQASVAIAVNSRGDVLGMSGNCWRIWDGTCELTWPLRAILWRHLGQTASAQP